MKRIIISRDVEASILDLIADFRRGTLGNRPGSPARQTLRPSSPRRGRLGQGTTDVDLGDNCHFCPESGCISYADPQIPHNNGCPGGWNGCGDTVGVNQNVAAAATVNIVVNAGIEFTPRFFDYTGPATTFLINGAQIAAEANAHFGPGYAADVHAAASFISKAVSWPMFTASVPLLINVTNLDAMNAQDFTGRLRGVAAHT